MPEHPCPEKNILSARRIFSGIAGNKQIGTESGTEFPSIRRVALSKA